MNGVPEDINVQDLFCVETRPAPFIIVIFGASGDLAHRKLLPSLYRLYDRGLLPETFHIVGCGRKTLDDSSFRQSVRDGIAVHGGISGDISGDFISRCHYRPGG